MNDDFFTRFREPPRHEFAVALYKRISSPMNIKTDESRIRAVAITLTAIVILAFGVLAIPSVRAFADGILHQVGGYAFQEGQVDLGPHAPSSVGIDQSYNSVSIVTYGAVPKAKDAAAASQLAGFHVVVPIYLPPGYTEMGEWYVQSEGNGWIATHGYRGNPNHFLVITQLKQGKNQVPRVFARDQIVDVTVRGYPGVWLPGGKEALVWEENGITYSLISDSLSLDELMKVAKSLGQ